MRFFFWISNNSILPFIWFIRIFPFRYLIKKKKNCDIFIIYFLKNKNKEVYLYLILAYSSDFYVNKSQTFFKCTVETDALHKILYT